MTPDDDAPFYALSLGGGQISSALAIAIADRLVVNGYDFGRFAPLGACSFADTGGELRSTYAHIEIMRAYLAERGVRLDVVKARGRSLPDRVIARIRGDAKSCPAIPFHLDGNETGRANQHCTRDMKSRPIDRNTARLARAAGKRHNVQVLIGYCIDEIDRVRNDVPESWPRGWTWRYPLIEAGVGRGWAQEVCLGALGYFPVMSACAFCPHRPDVGPGSRAWIRDNEPDTWARIVAFDAAIRGGYGGIRGTCYLSALRRPIAKACDAAEAQRLLFPSCGRDNGRCFT